MEVMASLKNPEEIGIIVKSWKKYSQICDYIYKIKSAKTLAQMEQELTG